MMDVNGFAEHVSCSLSSLEGGYIGDCRVSIGATKGDASRDPKP